MGGLFLILSSLQKFAIGTNFARTVSPNPQQVNSLRESIQVGSRTAWLPACTIRNNKQVMVST
jgi:hypothetical protein